MNNPPPLDVWKIANGLIAQQGSLEYLLDILTGVNQDKKFWNALMQAEASGNFPEFFQRLRGRGVKVRYEYVETNTNHEVQVGDFPIGEVTVRIDESTGELVASVKE